MPAYEIVALRDELLADLAPIEALLRQVAAAGAVLPAETLAGLSAQARGFRDRLAALEAVHRILIVGRAVVDVIHERPSATRTEGLRALGLLRAVKDDMDIASHQSREAARRYHVADRSRAARIARQPLRPAHRARGIRSRAHRPEAHASSGGGGGGGGDGDGPSGGDTDPPPAHLIRVDLSCLSSSDEARAAELLARLLSRRPS